jgi:hypothetical protein
MVVLSVIAHWNAGLLVAGSLLRELGDEAAVLRLVLHPLEAHLHFVRHSTELAVGRAKVFRLLSALGRHTTDGLHLNT